MNRRERTKPAGRLINVACCQFAPQFGATAQNLDRLAELARAARADLTVFPELCTSGYEFRGRAEVAELALEPGGMEMRRLKELAANLNCHLALGFPERAGGRLYNSAALIQPSGEMTIYRKIHLFEREKQRFNEGDTPAPVVETAVGRLGLMICFDWIFPELARSLALAGAQILVHPSNLVLHYCQQAMFARAVENRVFCVTCNRTGSESRAGRDMAFTGGSQILNPKGERLAQAPADGEAIIKATINPSEADDKMITPNNHVLADRRPELYNSPSIW